MSPPSSLIELINTELNRLQLANITFYGMDQILQAIIGPGPNFAGGPNFSSQTHAWKLLFKKMGVANE